MNYRNYRLIECLHSAWEVVCRMGLVPGSLHMHDCLLGIKDVRAVRCGAARKWDSVLRG